MKVFEDFRFHFVGFFSKFLNLGMSGVQNQRNEGEKSSDLKFRSGFRSPNSRKGLNFLMTFEDFGGRNLGL